MSLQLLFLGLQHLIPATNCPRGNHLSWTQLNNHLCYIQISLSKTLLVFSIFIQLLCISELIKVQGMDSNLCCFPCSQPDLVGRVCARASVSIRASIRSLEKSNDKTESLFLVNGHWIRLQLHQKGKCPTAQVNSWANALLPGRPRAQNPRRVPANIQTLCHWVRNFWWGSNGLQLRQISNEHWQKMSSFEEINSSE